MRKDSRYRKWIAGFFVVLLCICLGACSREESGPKTVVRNNKTYTIDDEAMTISDGKHTYRYQIQGSGTSRVDFDITYPDGSSYYWTQSMSGGMGHGYGGWSDDYDEKKYVDGQTLIAVLETQIPEPKEPKNVILIFILIAVGLFNALTPETAWYLSDGWRYKNAEPSDTALEFTRFGGIAAIVIGVLMILA